MSSLDEFARRKLDSLEQAHLRRSLVPTGRTDGLWVERKGRRLLSFSCNDYLGFTQHPDLKIAAIRAIERYGVGAGASRLVTGDHPLYAELEQRLARMKGDEAACVFGSGYLANAGITPVLAGDGDLILIDELAHSSLWTGARLSRAETLPFRHNDVAHVRQLLGEHRARYGCVLIVTEGVFSMDGDRAPLKELAALAREFDAWLLADDAHDLDMGAAARVGVPIKIGTLSKALGTYGGYVCASKPVIDLLRNRARTLIYTTGLPPPVIAGAIAALDLIEREPQRLELPLQKARAFTRAAGLPQAQSTIVPVVIGDAHAALEASRLLEAEGFLTVAIRPPTVPDGTARLRFSFSAVHPDDAIARVAELVRSRIIGNR
ncbi:aminotransferase class I/II-fold pyridoxal phosphate-dependent enzyme [Rhodoplanes sp. Z2-YC6860]|uniref:aminotransferase class I/II-fold pyridoxal phosphate-dependent enzyme n=1 Tax=Rhodoplanes sp. Z2-YC6860 TaxID=674703 RepID=UPI00078B6502|nr:aminotransferase class I/II-fold pyridoxal phosphate-dependent enzyme [Rhodoplanes sp. Z2-YC6860]AMN42027.1 8-amino-7-oxononanoate synthase [Rhodoplanes sp. Z2-YC6860]